MAVSFHKYEVRLETFFSCWGRPSWPASFRRIRISLTFCSMAVIRLSSLSSVPSWHPSSCKLAKERFKEMLSHEVPSDGLSLWPWALGSSWERSNWNSELRQGILNKYRFRLGSRNICFALWRYFSCVPSFWCWLSSPTYTVGIEFKIYLS